MRFSPGCCCGVCGGCCPSSILSGQLKLTFTGATNGTGACCSEFDFTVYLSPIEGSLGSNCNGPSDPATACYWRSPDNLADTVSCDIGNFYWQAQLFKEGTECRMQAVLYRQVFGPAAVYAVWTASADDGDICASPLTVPWDGCAAPTLCDFSTGTLTLEQVA